MCYAEINSLKLLFKNDGFASNTALHLGKNGRNQKEKYIKKLRLVSTDMVIRPTELALRWMIYRFVF